VGLANRLGLILPTGRTKDPDELTDVPFGSGITQTYAEGIIDKPLFGNFLTLSSSFRYSYSWRASRDYRLITDPNFPLSPNKESIQYKPGDRVIAKGRADVRVFGPLHGYSSYAVERRWSDQIRGNDSTYNYGVLESNTDIEIDTAEFGLTYSTVKMFQAKRFPVPFDVTASYSRVVGGRNTELVSLAFAEFSLFF
jgi:hypothetical protein